MARSPFTLVAAVTAALPGAEVVGARALTSGGDGRFDSAVATLADGRELAIRVADDDETARELAEEALALRALTAGVREMLPFQAPSYIGETRVGEGRGLVTELLPGFHIDAQHLPAGRGAAPSVGAAIAAVHALPTSVVRSVGLTVRDPEGVRGDVRRLIDRAASTGRVPARLATRWREAVDDDELWRFESTVTLGGIQAGSFLFQDDPERGPEVTGVLGWRGLSVGDPAEDLGWLSGAPDAADDVHAAYEGASTRASDDALRVRARLHAELEFARWLVHGDALRRSDIVEDAAALLESLAQGLRDDDLTVATSYTGGVDSALDVLERVPQTSAVAVDTSMQTDAYRPEDLWHDADHDADAADEGDGTDAGPVAAESDHDAETGRGEPADEAPAAVQRPAGWEEPTQDLTDVSGVRGSGSRGPDRTPSGTDAQPSGDTDADGDSEDEAQRAARAALQRWTSSASE
ncbi:phosphotransferase [Microbacterium sp.]|uniref:phosphotransferase n=1 Tax=Microbacterium sp. TaxID=51671 RepID=UPI0028112AB1|nr:phosphotransferase [Microbacterium sp.]